MKRSKEVGSVVLAVIVGGVIFGVGGASGADASLALDAVGGHQAGGHQAGGQPAQVAPGGQRPSPQQAEVAQGEQSDVGQARQPGSGQGGQTSGQSQPQGTGGHGQPQGSGGQAQPQDGGGQGQPQDAGQGRPPADGSGNGQGHGHGDGDGKSSTQTGSTAQTDTPPGPTDDGHGRSSSPTTGGTGQSPASECHGRCENGGSPSTGVDSRTPPAATPQTSTGARTEPGTKPSTTSTSTSPPPATTTTTPSTATVTPVPTTTTPSTPTAHLGTTAPGVLAPGSAQPATASILPLVTHGGASPGATGAFTVPATIATPGSGTAPAQAAVARLGAPAPATARVRADAGTARRAHHGAAHQPVSVLPAPVSSSIRITNHLIPFIPTAVWIALAASLGLALAAGAAAVRWNRRVRRQQRELAAIAAAASTDALTGVLNRRGFTEAAERELARASRYQRPLMLAYLDVSGLKAVNDSQGHLAGDELLTGVATLLKESARADDVVGRIGGDEFGLLLAEQSAEGAAPVIRRIRARVGERRAAMGIDPRWDLTIGTAAFPHDGASLDELLRVADRRLYEQRGIALP